MIATTANYDEREEETRAKRSTPYSVFLLNPTKKELERMYIAIRELPFVSEVTEEQRPDGITLSWSFAAVGKCATYHDRQRTRRTPRRIELATGRCNYDKCGKSLDGRRADAMFCDKACLHAEWRQRNREALAKQDRERNVRRRAERKAEKRLASIGR